MLKSSSLFLKAALLSALLAAVSLPTLCAAEVRITKGPYLQNPTQHSIVIMWEQSGAEDTAATLEKSRSVAFTPTDRVKGIVKYGKDKSLAMESQATATEVCYRDKGDKGVKTAYLFTCRLEGLETGTTYHYRAGDDTVMSHVSSFRTLPQTADDFTFVAYTDSHGGKPKMHAKICERIAREKPDFVLHMGDFVDRAEHYWEWSELFFEPAAALIDHIPLWPSPGNHDGIGGWEPYKQLFTSPDDEMYYSFDYGNAHFVSLNSFALRDKAMLQWCEKDLAASKAMWKIVFLHVPAFGVGRYPCDWGWRQYIPMFEKCRVNLFLCGHLHIYQRLYPLYLPGSKPESAITYVINSGTGGKLRKPGTHPTVASAALAAQYTVYRIAGTELSARAVDIDGNAIDEYEIRRKADGAYDEAYVASAQNARSLMVRELFPKGYAATVPTQDEPSEIFFHITAGGLGLKEKIELEVKLTEETGKHYTLLPETVMVTVDPQKALPLKIKVLAKPGVTPSLRGRWFNPLIFVQFDYKTSYAEGSAVSRVSFVEKKWW